MLDPGAAADEAAGLEMVGGAEAGAEEGPFHADQELAHRVHRLVEGDRLQAGVLDIDLEMVLQVAADTRQVGHHRHGQRAELVGRPDAGQHQQLRRVDGAAAEDDLAGGPRLADLAALAILDADRAVLLEQHPPRQRACLDGEVRPLHRR